MMNPILAHDLPAFFLVLFVKSTLLLLGAWAASLTLRRASAATRHLVWSAALVSILLLPLMSLSLPRWDVAMLRHATSPPAKIEMPRPVAQTPPSPMPFVPDFTRPAKPSPMPLVSGIPHASEPDAAVVSPAPNQTAIKIVRVYPYPTRPMIAGVVGIFIWFIGLLAVLGPLALGLHRIGQIGQHSVPLEPQALQIAKDAQEKIGLRRPVRFLRAAPGSTMAVPVTWGLYRPIVLLPPQSTDWSEDCTRAALLHELAHVQRYDWRAQLVGRLACALYWWHPLVWIAARRARAESELACDDCVLRAGLRPSDYAQRLVEVVRSMPAGGSALTVAVAMAQPSEVEGRLQSILARGRDRRPISRKRTVLLGVTVGLALLPLAMFHAVARAQAPAQTPPATASTQAWKAREQQSINNMRRISLAILEYRQDHAQRLPALQSISLLEKDLEPYLKQQEKFPDPTTHQPYLVRGHALFISPLTSQPYRLDSSLSHAVIGSGFKLYQSAPPIIAKPGSHGAVHFYDSRADFSHGPSRTFAVLRPAVLVLFSDTPTIAPGGKAQQVLEAFADGHVKSRTFMQASGTAPTGKGKSDAKAIQSLSNMKQISLSILQYTQDYNEHLPSFRSIATIERELQPYLLPSRGGRLPGALSLSRYHAMFISTLSGKPYVFTTSLSGKPFATISRPAETIVFHDTPVRVAPGQPPVTIDAYADGHVKIRGMNLPPTRRVKTSVAETKERRNALGMQIIGLAVRRYAQDHHASLPSFRTVTALENDLGPYLKHPEVLFRTSQQRSHRIYPNTAPVLPRTLFVSPLTGQPYRLNASASHFTISPSASSGEVLLLSDLPTAEVPWRSRLSLKAFPDNSAKPKQKMDWRVTIQLDAQRPISNSGVRFGGLSTKPQTKVWKVQKSLPLTPKQKRANARLLALWIKKSKGLTAQTVQHLLAAGADVNAQDANGNTPLIWAASSGQTDIAQLLLSQGAAVNTKSSSGFTALMGAVDIEQSALVQLLLAHGAQANAQTHQGFTALMSATSPQIAQILKNHGADVNAKQTDGTTALMEAAMAGHTMMVKWLLDNSADVNAKDWQGTTALMDTAAPQSTNDNDTDASHRDDKVTIKTDLGSSFSIDSAGAEPKGTMEMVRLLLTHGADINAKNNMGDTPLLWASAWGNDDVSQLLIASGADVNVRDNLGATELMTAAKSGLTKTVRILLARGTDVNATDKEGQTALMVAGFDGKPAVIRMLLDHGAAINAKDNNGDTALNWAVIWNQADVVKALLAHGAKVNAKDKWGHTALYEAANKPTLIKLLRAVGAS